MVQLRDATVNDAAAVARVQVDTWRTNYGAIVPSDYLAALSYVEREGRWRTILEQQSATVLVAEDHAAQVVGFASSGPKRRNENYDGEISALYVLADYQRQGIGRRLVAATARELLSRGMRSMIVYVFAANPARAFYESLGGRLVFEGHFELGGVRIADVGYGWENIEPLAAA